MNIFYKRPLALILCIGLCGFFIFGLEIKWLRWIFAAISFLPLFLTFIQKFQPNAKILLRLSTVVLLISILLSHLYFDCNFKAYKKYDDEVEIVGTVEDVSKSSSYNLRLEVKAETINDKKVNYRFYAYPSKNEAKGITLGTRIRFSATLGGFSDESMFYNISDGINAYANDINNIEIIERTNGTIKTSLATLREKISRWFILKTDAESGSLISALLLGERDYLTDQLRLDFKRIGISHILALSGMHLAVLSLGVGTLLKFLKVKKKLRTAIICLFIILYMALTGFPVSVCRAGIMIIISSLLFLCGRTKDSFTSLFVAVFIICLITPYAIYDISLWLSALATLGIIALGEQAGKIRISEGMFGNAIKYICFALFTSVFAISATLIVSGFCFDGFSILAPFATLVFSILAEVVMYLGCLVFIIGWIIPIGWIIRPITALLYSLAGWMSDIDFAYVSTNFTIAKIAIVIYSIIFFGFLLVRLNDKKLATLVVAVAFILTMFIPTVATAVSDNEETISYSGSSKCDLILVRSEGEVCVINSSNYSKSTGYDVVDLLTDAKATSIDAYYFTHYSWSLDDDIEAVLYSVNVNKIYLPIPRNNDELLIYKIILAMIDDYSAEIVLFRESETVKVGEYSINLLHSTPYGQTSMNAVTICDEDTVGLYISSGLLQDKYRDEYEKYIYMADYLILGDHGKKYSEKVYLKGCYENMTMFINHSENIYLVQENMQYLLNIGCEIHSHPKEIIYIK